MWESDRGEMVSAGRQARVQVRHDNRVAKQATATRVGSDGWIDGRGRWDDTEAAMDRRPVIVKPKP